MTMWSYTTVVATGSPAGIDQLSAFLRDAGSGFNSERVGVIPAEIFRDGLGAPERALCGKLNWYDWRVAHSRVTWNSHNFEQKRLDTPSASCLAVHFSNPKYGPMGVIKVLADKFPALDFAFCEVSEEDPCYTNVLVQLARREWHWLARRDENGDTSNGTHIHWEVNEAVRNIVKNNPTMQLGLRTIRFGDSDLSKLPNTDFTLENAP